MEYTASRFGSKSRGRGQVPGERYNICVLDELHIPRIRGIFVQRQVTFGDTVLKGNATKIRTLHEGKVLAGFAGSTADAFNLFDMLYPIKLNT